MCILLLACATGCTLSMAEHTIRATGRFASAAITSGGDVVGAAASTAVGTGLDLINQSSTHPVGGKLVTLVNPETGIRQDLIWREGMNIYTARRTLAITAAPPTYEITRDGRTLEAAYNTVLEPGDVVRWVAP